MRLVGLNFFHFNTFIAILAFYVSSCFSYVSAQEISKADVALIKNADDYYLNEQYAEAYLLYLELQSKFPDNIKYSFRFNACSLYTNDDKSSVIPLLDSMIKNPDIEPEKYYFLGKAFMLNHRFSEAISMFSIYRQRGSAFNARRFQIDRLIEMCNNAQNYNQKLNGWIVIDSFVVGRDTILRPYYYKGISGVMAKKPEGSFYNTTYDYMYDKELSTVYMNPQKTLVFLSTYGVEEGHNKNLFLTKKLPNGEWGTSQELPSIINSNYDENYPFLHPDGKTLYFSSKGHNSIGGYDIFKSTYNDTTNLWSEPQSLGIPINTVDDDILFSIDSTGTQITYSTADKVSSNRLVVYRLSSIRQTNLVYLKGFVEQNVNVKSEIAVIDLSNYALIGNYKPNKKNGRFFMAIPPNKKLLFQIKYSNQNFYKEAFFNYDTSELYNKIVLDAVNNSAKLIPLTSKEIDEYENRTMVDAPVVAVVAPETVAVIPIEQKTDSVKKTPDTLLVEANKTVLSILKDTILNTKKDTLQLMPTTIGGLTVPIQNNSDSVKKKSADLIVVEETKKMDVPNHSVLNASKDTLQKTIIPVGLIVPDDNKTIPRVVNAIPSITDTLIVVKDTAKMEMPNSASVVSDKAVIKEEPKKLNGALFKEVTEEELKELLNPQNITDAINTVSTTPTTTVSVTTVSSGMNSNSNDSKNESPLVEKAIVGMSKTTESLVNLRTVPTATITNTDIPLLNASVDYELMDVFPSFFFENRKSVFDGSYTDEIKSIADFMNSNNNLVLELRGYSNSKGTDSYNKALASDRALYVKRLLMKQGVSSYRIKAIGIGKFNVKSLGDNIDKAEIDKMGRRVDLDFNEAKKKPTKK